jgi:Glycine rich protein
VHATATATTKFSSPGPDLFTVPPGVTSITVTAVGGRGGAWIPKSPETPHPAGGKGAAVSATLAVSPGEQLFVRVGGPGGDGFADQGNGGAGGIGGGGAGGSSGGGILPGGGGGGASLVGASSPSPGFRGSLVVAGGGGGANRFTTGGDSGSPGGNGKLINCDPFKDPSSTDCGQGGAGTLTSGGARGSWPGHDDEFLPGAPGDFLVGGSGGSGHDCDNFGVCQKGGGGGGGGYYGGGGGNAYDYGGGGGGSSFVSPDATNVSMGLSSDAPSVALTYAAPTADVSPTTPMHFDLREPGTTSPAKILTVTNNGSAPLDVSAVLLGGSDPGDFLFNDRCQQPVAVGSSCEVGVRFSPQVSGARSATLTLLTNAAIAPPAVALLAGASAAAKVAKGPAGEVELLSCRPMIKLHEGRLTAVRSERCAGKVVHGRVRFTAVGASTRASLVRGRVIFAAGASVPTARGGSELVLAERRPVRHGTYTLILRRRHGRRWVTRRLPLILR